MDGLGQVRDFDSHNHPLEMSALRLSLGCLGIIVQVTIECVEDHSVELNEFPMTYAEFLKSFESLYQDHERVRAYWFPGSDRVFVNTMNRIDSPLKPGSPYSWFEAVIQRRLVLSLLWGIGRSVPDWVPTCNRFQEKVGFRKARSVAPCFNAITTPMMAHHQEAEVAVPIDRAREAVEAYGEWVTKNRLTVNVPSEIRFCKADDVLLSPGYEVDTCYIGGYNAMYRQHDPFYEGFCDEMQNQFGARPHWGKIGAPTRAEAQRLFPGFGQFEAIRRQFDPNGVFANKYIRDLFAL